jgi:hypothetical protein
MKAQKYVLCIVELRVTANNTKAFNFAQLCFYGEFISPTTIKRTYLRVKCTIFFCRILTKFEFMKTTSSNFTETRPVAAALIRTSGQMHMTKLTGTLCDYSNASNKPFYGV